MKIYVAGKISGLENYKEVFGKAEQALKELGHSVMNPAVLPAGFDYEDYMQICFKMIDVCDAVYFLQNYKQSLGALREFDYANELDKILIIEVETRAQ